MWRLLPEALSFFLWLCVWIALGWLVGFIFDGHFWVVIPMSAGVHGFIGGLVFTLCCARQHRRTGRVPAARGAIYGALAGVAGLTVLRMLTWFSIYVVLIVLAIDVVFGMALALALFRTKKPNRSTGLSSLSERDKQTVFECLRATSEGPFFPDSEFTTLFGLPRDTVHRIVSTIPHIDDSSEEVALAIQSAMGNLIGYPHHQEAAWSKFISVTEEEVSEVFRKWRSDRE